MNFHHNLKIDFCSYEAAKYAVEHWHYSKKMPSGKRVLFGVWEKKHFVGVVIFSSGAAPQAHRPYEIQRTQICELTRVALQNGHLATVSRIISICLKLIQKQSPGLRLVVSYADPLQGHHGGVYQAGNWIYVGVSECTHFESPTGRMIHSKTLCTGRKGYATQLRKAGVIRAKKFFKFKYLMPLDNIMKLQIGKSLPYPKREDIE